MVWDPVYERQTQRRAGAWRECLANKAGAFGGVTGCINMPPSLHLQQSEVKVGGKRIACACMLLHPCNPGEPALSPPTPILRWRSLAAGETWFIRTKFARNTAMYGGAVLLEGGCPAGFFVNCTFSGNRADNQGKDVYVRSYYTTKVSEQETHALEVSHR